MMLIVLSKYLDFAIMFDNLELLIDCLRMCGEAYLDFDNIPNAFFCFDQLVFFFVTKLILLEINLLDNKTVQEDYLRLFGSRRMHYEKEKIPNYYLNTQKSSVICLVLRYWSSGDYNLR